MGNHPGAGTDSVSTTLADEFLFTVSPGKSFCSFLLIFSLFLPYTSIVEFSTDSSSGLQILFLAVSILLMDPWKAIFISVIRPLIS